MTLLPLLLAMSMEATATAPKLPVEQYQLDNGLTVLLSEDHALPVVSIEVLYLVGSGHERPGRTGFAHLFEHQMFKSTTNLPPETIDRLTEDVGGGVSQSRGLR